MASSPGFTAIALAFLLAATVHAQQADNVADAASDDPTSRTTARLAPVELKIPSIGVDAEVFPVGLDADGAMDVPPDPDAVAWWSLGHGTGEPGNIVLAAHVDWGGRLRVFGQLHRLAPGDSVVLIDELAREFWFEVTQISQVAADGAAVAEIFSSGNERELTLITCGGQFDYVRHEYPDRLIVRARQV